MNEWMNELNELNDARGPLGASAWSHSLLTMHSMPAAVAAAALAVSIAASRSGGRSSLVKANHMHIVAFIVPAYLDM